MNARLTPPGAGPSVAPNAGSRLEPRRVLLVEDEESHSEVVRRAFSDVNSLFDLVVVSSLTEARAKLKENKFDLVVSDWHLPDGQGIELIPLDCDYPPFAILLMTSHGTEHMAVRALKAGSVDYIVKSAHTLSDMPHLCEQALREWDNRVARREAEEAIRISLQEKEALLQEIHHRVKNNLQIICSLLQLHANESEDPKLQEVLAASQSRIRSMALIHEMLYQGDSLSQIDLSRYLRGLMDNLVNIFCKGESKHKVDVEVTGAAVNLETAMHLGFIANELVTNALKYAFPNRRVGVVSVRCHPLNATERIFEVADDGVGFPPDFDLSRCTSVGLNLAQMFSKKLRAKVQFHSGDKGVRFSMTFALPAIQPVSILNKHP